jgi:hypothetical protein
VCECVDPLCVVRKRDSGTPVDLTTGSLETLFLYCFGRSTTCGPLGTKGTTTGLDLVVVADCTVLGLHFDTHREHTRLCQLKASVVCCDLTRL